MAKSNFKRNHVMQHCTNKPIIIMRLAPPHSSLPNLAWIIVENHTDSVKQVEGEHGFWEAHINGNTKWKGTKEGIIPSQIIFLRKNSVAYIRTKKGGQPISWNIVQFGGAAGDPLLCFNSWNWPSTLIRQLGFLSIIQNNGSWKQRYCKLNTD